MSLTVPISRRTCLAAASAIALLGACGTTDDRDLRFWAMGREGEVAPELLDGFRHENPGIRLRIEQLPWTAAHEKLLTAFAGNATPDVAQIGNTWLPEMQALGALEPLTAYLNATPSISPADHFAGIWRSNLIGKALYGIPWYVDTRLMFIRRDLLAKAGFASPPQDWTQLSAGLAALRRGGMQTPLLLPVNEFEPLLALALQQDDELLRDGGRYGNFSGPGFRRALGYYKSLFDRGYAPAVNNNQVANLWQEFGRGTFAFYISGPWNIGEFKRRLPPEEQGGWGTAPLPGPMGLGNSIAGGSSLALFKRSRAKPMAWKLIEYLSRPAVQLRFYQLTGNLPPRRSSWAMPIGGDASLLQDPYAKAFAEQLERVRPPPAVPEWERIVQEMQLFAARVVQGGMSIDTAVAGLDERVDEMLSKRRWMLDRSGNEALKS